MEQLRRYVDLLLKWNKVYNLTAIHAKERVWVLHVLDSLAALRAFEQAALRTKLEFIAPQVLDVGSGAGVPGLVWAIARPNWQIVCVDAVAKKASFMKQAVAELGLSNAEPRHERVEKCSDQFDVVTSRAFSDLHDFVDITKHVKKEWGIWCALKSKLVDEEVEYLRAGANEVDVFHVEHFSVPSLDAERSIVLAR